VDYRLQACYFARSRVFGTLATILFIAAGLWSFTELPPEGFATSAVYFAILAATAISLYYTPDYLHLSINDAKPSAWATKIMWRIIAAVLIFGLLLHHEDRAAAITAAAALAFANLIHRKIVNPRFSSYYWWSVLFALLGLLSAPHINNLLILGLCCAATHFATVIARKLVWITAVLSFFLGAAVLTRFHGDSMSISASALVTLLVVSIFTALLTRRAIRHTESSASTAIRELHDFAGKSEEEIRHLWATSNQALAANWKAAHLRDNDPEAMKRWYAENSSLYLFAISGHNLEYKKIRSNLANLAYARGHCLDYGAGNGEVVLEEARRGCSAVYYDVPGETARFASWRAQQQGLTLAVSHSKEELLALVQRDGAFDSITSFDVLEHLPDLRGELTFLESILAPGGRLLFDVPAGATKNHPMHLNHHLNVAEHMKNLGLVDARNPLQRLFASKERYMFCKPV
jgi:2-polyprenyl-3-methyl-5-hydroxy-6-metoxy-1,4-benzoquinol methylase